MSQQISPCLLGTGFLMSMVYTMGNKGSEISQQFQRSLTPEQSQIHQEIHDQRQSLFFQGLILGTILGGAYLYFNSGASAIKNACLFTTIVMTVMTFYYKLSPKSKYMVEYLTLPAQKELWVRVYREYQVKYYLGFLLGIVGYLLIGYALSQGVLPAMDFIPQQFNQFSSEFF